MMIGEASHCHPNPTVHVPPWSFIDDSTADISYGFAENANVNCGDYGDCSSFLVGEAMTALRRYLPSNEVDSDEFPGDRELDFPLDVYSCDNFRMFEFKVRRCARGRSHDWTECPYAHPGEKARRRDPRKIHYSGTACPDFRKGNCKKGELCEYAHGVFECWLHPARYRTQPCKDGTGCRRRVCFFAHTPEQLRVLPQQSPRAVGDSYDGSPLRLAKGLCISPPVTSPTESPPVSPVAHALSRSLGSNSVNEMVTSFRSLQLGKVKSMPSWGLHMGGYGSPRSPLVRPGFCSLPSTPTRPGLSYRDVLDRGVGEEPVMERVESGRDLRARMFEKLSKENSLERDDPGVSSGSGPDVGWVTELVK